VAWVLVFGVLCAIGVPLARYRARTVDVLSDHEQPRELDGDIIAPARSLVVTIRPNTLSICAPAPTGAPQQVRPVHRHSRSA
jgi:hypothetical protein